MTKEELSKLQKIIAEIEQIKRELESIEPEYAIDSVTGSSINFPYTQHNIMIEGYDIKSYEHKVKRIQNRLNHKMIELVEEKDRLTEYIYSLDNSDLRQILSHRYVRGLTWQDVGINMGYATITVRSKHDKFLKSVSPNITFKGV
ncbi:RNA polymerase subunit sigma-24 [Clostridium sp.]|uniref:RNA polymerase subunit sigma-24 n=1 Tax=Clostridium sp. TaxID=1506 RepID=UPI001A36E4B0|nr:RNA polymerase subunit sigma-24 [Clostridium sp.]MBK5243197.1 RNA polymerase subunit sigma-24 [Clostridium sp.]